MTFGQLFLGFLITLLISRGFTSFAVQFGRWCVKLNEAKKKNEK